MLRLHLPVLTTGTKPYACEKPISKF